MNPENESDALALLSQSLLHFFTEVEADRQVCIRHAATTDLVKERDILQIMKRYQCVGDSTRHLREQVRLLQERRSTPPFPVRQKEKLSDSVLFNDWVLWGHDAVHVTLLLRGSTLTVTTFVTHPYEDLPVSPLRRVAQALACHESLAPSLWCVPMRVSRNRKHLWPLQAYLLRAMRCFAVPPKSAFLSWPER